jgi:hypothetical protein
MRAIAAAVKRTEEMEVAGIMHYWSEFSFAPKWARRRDST